MLESILLMTLLFTDTTGVDKVQSLDEVLIVSASDHKPRKRSVKGQAASIDEHLGQLRGVGLIRRGAYAWEPAVNNMQMERLSTTIDGMKIFYACTDKMDPVTSYVESGNLESISLNSGLDGNPQATGNIGGALDLKLRKTGFDGEPLLTNVLAGHEWNGHLQVYGGDVAVSRQRTYLNGGAFYRRGDNYRAGGGDVIDFSQFRKFNAFANAGLRLTDRDVVEMALIFDRATDVGYPALNMDVGKAQAVISSLAFRHLFSRAAWETKLYYNHIVHEMDDTQRPDVEIHMDMPGRSTTAGFYSLLTTSREHHDIALNADAYYNRLFADMTMYPGGAAPMYMVTWPDVRTLNGGVSLTDNIRLDRRQTLRLSAKLSWQRQQLNNDEGYHALSVFFPGMERSYHQTTGRIAASYAATILPSLKISLGAGWGSRAPSVTEAYGYYLNNTFDRYDYMGNPSLHNESAVELNAAVQWTPADGHLTVTLSGNTFLFSHYIIGLREPRLSAMTVGAEGVKVYYNLDHAQIANVALDVEWQLAEQLLWSAKATYGVGRDDEGDALPLVAPFGWQTALAYTLGRLQLQAAVRGNAHQTDNGYKYGEAAVGAWSVADISAQYPLGALTLRAGIENVFDRHYSTYADWNHIPQKGRNLYLHANYTF